MENNKISFLETGQITGTGTSDKTEYNYLGENESKTNINGLYRNGYRNISLKEKVVKVNYLQVLDLKYGLERKSQKTHEN